MQFLKYAILFVSIILILDLALYFVLNVRPASGSENNAVRDIFVITGGIIGNAVNAVKQNIESVQETISAENKEKSEKTPSQNSTQTTQTIAQTNATANTTQIIQNNTQTQEEIQDSCLEKFNLTSDMIIFYHSNDIHSNAMIPIVSDLDGIYKFHDISNLWDYEFNHCFGLSGTVPSFVCAGSKEKLEGEVSKTVLEDFCKRC